ncbi:MAG: PD-(D/E)XK nuclease family protein [Marinilabiliaceae bacterium]|nr:PD-(D/E)XK nuclease family protein [Marinilabiliaceae bacterium]
MQPFFLSSLANYYYQQYGTAISDFCFVFPSRRAGIFFKNNLTELSDTPIWSPKILTINEFIDIFNKGLVPDNITLLFKLFNSYKSVVDPHIEFDDFISTGEMLLSDFEDIDKYLVDASLLFKNLVSYKEIEADYSFLSDEQIDAIKSFWSSFNPNKLSEHQDSFLKKWEQFFPLYEQFKIQLENEGFAYSGMQLRNLIEQIKSDTPPNVPFPKVIFCGFFILTPAEKELFKFIKNLGIADFIWDYSNFIMHDRLKESLEYSNTLPFKDAGSFMRENLLAFPPPVNWELSQKNESPDITITGVASKSEQLRIVTSFLETCSVETINAKPLETAVVLTNENMLIPVLHAIPDTYSKINVSLGYPLKNTPVYNLIELIINLQRNSKITQKEKTWFYFRDVLPIIQHQYISSFESETINIIRKEMLTKNTIFVEASQLWKNDFLKFIFRKIVNTEEIPEYISNILLQTYQLIKNKETTFFEQEYIFSLYKNVNKLSHLIGKTGTSVTPDTWLRLFKKVTQTQTIPFKGEPLSGLQVMGILETRALDFKNLIILNMNEGVFPKNSVPNSYIPYNLRKGMGLPTIEHQDAIFSYYFFRLIHRVEKLELVYNSSSDEMQTGEMSRFLYQIIYEHPSKPILRTAIDTVNIYQPPVVYTSKSEQVVKILKQYINGGQKSLSPSALSTYIECPLRFSFRYIHKIDEEEDISEDLDARVFGILFHWCMEELYKPWLGKTISKEELKQLSKNTPLIKSKIHQAFNKHFSELSLNTDDFEELQGKNILVFEVILKYIKKFIENDIQFAPIKINGLEKRINGVIEIDEKLKINIGGIIDRLDESNGITRVIDYKTGNGKNKTPDIASLFEPKKHKDLKAIFQTLVYSGLLDKNEFNKPVQPSVVWLKTLFQTTDYSLKIGQRTKTDEIFLHLIEDEFNEQLKKTLADLFNFNIPFHQTEETKICEYCTYKQLCNK